MNKRYWLVGLLSLFLATPLLAQQNQAPTSGRIVGVVTSDAGPLIAAQVLLRAGSDSVVARTTTAADGRFLLDKVPFGTYSVRVTFLGYKDTIIPDVAVAPAQQAVELGVILLQRQVIATVEKVAAHAR